MLKLLIGKTDELSQSAFWLFNQETRDRLKQNNVEVVTFGSQESDIIVSSFDHSYQDLEKELVRRNFSPDLGFIFTIGYGFLLEGLEKAPFPIALLYSEWFFTAENLRCVSQRADQLFVVLETSKRPVNRLTGMNPLSTSFSWLGDGENLFHPIKDERKLYDVTYVGNCNPYASFERASFIKRLALLPEKYRVFIGETKSEKNLLEGTNRINNQSKMCINFSQPYMRAVGTRVGHTLFSGTFLLTDPMVDENMLPSGTCAYYDLDTLEETIQYYLEHEEEREKIATHGLEWIRSGGFSFAKIILQMLEKLENLKQEGPLKRERPFNTLPLSQQLNSLGLQALYSSSVSKTVGLNKAINWFYQAYEVEPSSLEIANNLSVVCSACILFGGLTTEQQKSFEITITKCQEAIRQTTHSQSAMGLFNEALYYRKLPLYKNFNKVYVELSLLFEQPEEHLIDIFPHLGLVLTQFYDFFTNKKWEELFHVGFEQGVPIHGFYVGMKKFMLWKLNEWMAEFLVERTEHDAALEYYQLACSYMPEAEPTIMQWGKSLLHTKRLEEAKAAFEKSLSLNPLNLSTASSLCEVEMLLGNAQRGEEIAREYERVCERVNTLRSSVEVFRSLRDKARSMAYK